MKLILLITLGIISSLFPFSSVKTTISVNQTNTEKEVAFNILKTKCNSCHTKKKNRITFTLGNMNSLAPEIESQVFIKKKMPKGRKNQLTLLEEDKLRNWIRTL